ncbi:MAG: galactose mutarotase [bacterium]|nr:galactose mutarotase [bacterium]
MPIEAKPFGTVENQPVTQFELRNRLGHIVRLINYGAIITAVEVPDKQGTLANINLSLPELDAYMQRHPYLGSTVGRFCNRIAKGRFELDGKTYTLAINNGPNHLHGGLVGFDRLLWHAEPIETEDACAVRFSAVSPDGQEGYPGQLDLVAEYSWNDANELSYRFEATTSAPTVINMTNHSYWNLGGEKSGDILNHEVKMLCDRYLEVDDTLIPTGKYLPVEGTPLDFKEFHRLGERIEQLAATKGYDHCYVINGNPGEAPRLCGIARDPVSGRVMEVLTTQPGVQLYTGNHLGGAYPPYSGFCMETQHYPDSPNKPAFPTTRLDPGQTFQETTIHRFSVE